MRAFLWAYRWKENLILLSIFQSLSISSAAEIKQVQPISTEKEVQRMNHAIKQKHQAMIPIAAFSAVGNQPKLAQALRQGLDQGLTISQIKSLLVQSYAYAGFPRSLNALATFCRYSNNAKHKVFKTLTVLQVHHWRRIIRLWCKAHRTKVNWQGSLCKVHYSNFHLKLMNI